MIPERARRVGGRRRLGFGRAPAWLTLLGFGGALLACGSAPRGVTVYHQERFEPGETFSRLFDAGVEATCEAARRALLSQGYLLTAVRPDSLGATKNFQPEGDVHVQIVFNVVCVPESSPSGSVTTAYVSAVQDRYVLKKSPNSASVGVAAFGSVSIPLTASDDALVRVGSETIPVGQFYDRFFALMLQNLIARPGGD